MKLFFRIISVLAAIWAILIIADRSYRFSIDHNRRYIEISNGEEKY